MLSLEKMCLISIVTKFKRFYFAFKETNSEKLKQNFEFLQRKYSFELILILFLKNSLENEFLGFLLNKHLKIFNVAWIMPHTEMLSENHFFIRSREILCRLPNLTKINFRYNCCDEDVKNIAKFCPKVVEIDLSKSFVTNKGIKYLCADENGKLPCPELRKLYARKSGITHEGIKYVIQNIRSLELITHLHNIPLLIHSLHKEEFLKCEKVHTVYNLTSLDFHSIGYLPYYADILKICLIVCPNLKSVEQCCILDEQQLNLFSNLCLMKLDLTFKQMSPKINLNGFLKNSGDNITSLTIENCMLSISDLAVCCPKLNCLSMWYVSFPDDDDLQHVFQCLVKCTFGFTKSTTKNAIRDLLLFSPKLEYLEFCNSFITLDTKIHILKCCENQVLKKISFTDTNVEVKFLKDILSCCLSLTTLNFNKMENHLTYNDVKELVEFTEKLHNKPQIAVNNCSYSTILNSETRF